MSGLGLTTTHNIAVNSDIFGFTAPAADNTEILIGAAPQTMTVRWTSGGAAVVGQTINFATTRGTLSAASALTNGSGDATVTLTANGSAGGATITATAAGGMSAQRTVEFVATTPVTLDLQSSVFTLAPGEQSVLTAVVRDGAGNLVKNQTVVFTLDQDTTGGTLSRASAVTDSQGRAQSVYQAGSVTSGRDGVHVRANVQSAPAVADTVLLTVSRRELFISMGTGNTILEINADTQYQIDFAVQVTDASGNGVPNVRLALSILSDRYVKGLRVAAAPPATGWGTQVNAICDDEDLDNDGVLDLDQGEDQNGNGRIEAGNIALVTPLDATTDANGTALISVRYPQEFAYYVYVTLEARTSVQGTEFVRSSSFVLPGEAQDFNSSTTAPPGPTSPFGTANSCLNPN